MRLLTVNAASKEAGAPSQQDIDKKTKGSRVPAFAVQTDGGLRIDVEHPAWASFVAKSKGRSVSGKAGALVRERKEESKAGYSQEAVSLAVDQKIVEEARKAKFEADISEVKALGMTGKYIEKGMVSYYLSFIQRGANDAFSAVKKAVPDVVRLVKSDDVKGAEKLIISSAAVAFDSALKLAIDELQNEDIEE